MTRRCWYDPLPARPGYDPDYGPYHGACGDPRNDDDDDQDDDDLPGDPNSRRRATARGATLTDTIDAAKAASTAIAEYKPVEAGLAELRQRYANVVFDLTTAAGDKAARAARKELVTLRTSLEAKRKALKAPALDYSRRIDSEAQRITAEIAKLEEPIDEQIKADEQRREAERQRRADEEARRIAAHQARVAEIAAAPLSATILDAAGIARLIDDVREIRLGPEFEEFGAAAGEAKEKALVRLREMHAAAVAREAEAARLAAERAELERLRAEQAERERQERERVEAERRAEAERQRAERERIAAEQRAEAERLAAERARQAEQQRQLDEQAAALRRQQEAAIAEQLRIERERREQEEAEAAERARRAREQEAREAAARRAELEAAEAAADRVRATAPLLLAVLQSIETALNNGFSGNDILDENSPVRDALREAIARATGIESQPRRAESPAPQEQAA